MSLRRGAALVVLAASLGGVLAEAPARPAATMSAAECKVWNRERSFARAVEAHDEVAFTEHVLPGAVFNAGSAKPVRGRDAVLERWRPIIAGKDFKLRWYPGQVQIGGDPDVAISRGPFWTEEQGADGKPAYTTGTFSTIWRRGTDGVWRVLFDGGADPPKLATAEDIEKLKASLPAECQ